MKINGIDLSKLEDEAPPQFYIPRLVPGRTVHIDADFLAYHVSADDTKGVEAMKHNCEVEIEKIRLMAGAEKWVMHLTPHNSNKGGRYAAALLKEYQGNRKGKLKPKYLHVIRDWMHRELGAIMHENIEADDGMAMAQYKAIAEGKGHLSVIATRDKDLRMVPGLTLDWWDGVIVDSGDTFGFLQLDETKAQKKLRGRGTKFFWAQLLMGDTADNISGLPKVATERFINGKPKACGPVMAFNILDPTKSDKEAFEVVRELYRDYGTVIGFKNYRDGSDVPFGNALTSEAQLIWMRRKPEITDALDWMKETCL